MSRKKRVFSIDSIEEVAVDFFNYVLQEKPKIPFFIPVILIACAVEKWVFSFSTWVPLALAVWATIQYGRYQRKLLVEDLDKKWKRIILNNSPITPLEHCEWLNKLLTEIWPNYFNPKLSSRLSAIVEARLKLRKPRFLERVELQEFSLGSCPPSLALQGMRWSTIGEQRVMQLGFDWDTHEMSILLLAKLAKPLMGTARIVINSLHIKGDLIFTPILDGRALLYSFVSAPEVRVGVAFGSGGSQSLPATEWPGVSSWLEKLFTDTLVKTMVEPRRRCFTLPAVDLRKKAVGGIIYVRVISANKLSRSSFKASRRQQNGSTNGSSEDVPDDKDLHTFVEVEIEELTRRTDVRLGSTPRWDAPFNMVLHDNTGTLRFNLFECIPNNVKCDYLGSCEIKLRHVEDDSTIMWAIGPDSGVIAKQAQFCGDEIEMVVPFEGANSGELKVSIVVKEWQFSDGTHSLNNLRNNSQQSLNGSSNIQLRTGKKLKITVVEGKDLAAAKEKSGKFDPYIKLQYGKVMQKTKTSHTPNPVWNQTIEFDEVGGGEYLKLKVFTEELFGDENIGSAQVNLEGLVDGSVRDVWIPLERVRSGEIRLKIEAIKVDDQEGSTGSGSGNGWIELVLIEGRDLVAADLRGTSDPYVRVHYGNFKKRTKVIYKTLTPQWNQTLEFPDDGSPLMLYVKDHNALLPTSSIGECVVEYQRLPPNQMADKWIPLQGVKKGEIHIQITRKVPEMQKRQSMDSEPSLSKLHQIPSQIKQMMIKFRSQIEDGNLEGLTTTLSELETLEDTQEGYVAQLETEQMLLLSKIKELGQEIINSSPSPSLSRRHSESVNKKHKNTLSTMDLLLLEKTLLALFIAATIAVTISKLRGKRFKLPPGPIPVPIFGNWLQVGDDLNHRNLTDYAKRFGEIFLLRMGQRNLVVVSSPELAKEVLHTQGVEFGSRTRNVVFDIFTGKGQDMVFTVYGEHWRKMRRIMTVPFFTNKVVQQYRYGWESEAESVVNDVKNNAEASVGGIVIRKRLQLMMYNIMYRIMFDRRFESEEDPLFVKLKALNGERSRLAQSFEYNYGDFIPILRPFLKGYLKVCKEVKDRRLQLFKDYFVDERKKLESTKSTTSNDGLKCAIDHILDAQKKGEINDDNVLYIVENINVAAIETTLWSIEWGIAELVNHQDIQNKVREEMDRVLGPGHQVTEPDLHKLPYLQAVIKETLRLRMAIPLLVPHMNLHDAKLNGFDIPAESKILVNAWWLANNPAHWKKPEEFRPERFLEEESHVEANGNDFRYLPFGVGRRSCPGIILALPILGITIGRLVQNFELLPPPGQSKIDTSEKGGQFSLHILKHSTIVAKPRSF